MHMLKTVRHVKTKGATYRKHGFTIVELLIVIVVIGILATITVVAYNSVQARAQAATVTSDMRRLAQALRMHEADQGSLPTFGSQVGAGGSFPDFSFQVSKSAYSSSDGYNLYVCRDRATEEFGMAARTKSGDIIAYSSARGFIEYNSTSLVSATTCRIVLDLGSTSNAFWYSIGMSGSNVWYDNWIKG